MLMELLDEVVHDQGVDRDSIYAAGLSAGAGMAVVLAALHPDRFAGVAAHSGVPYASVASEDEAVAVLAGRGPPVAELADRMKEAMPPGAELPRLIAIHGTADEVVSPENTRRLAAAWLLVQGRSSSEPDESERGRGGRAPYAYDRRRWSAGDPAPVETWLVEGLGHAWSGGSSDGTWADPAGPDATAAVLRSFGLVRDGPEP